VDVVPDAGDGDELDCVEEGDVAPPHAAKANERMTTNGRTLQRNFK